jgi:diguanylate cyclase
MSKEKKDAPPSPEWGYAHTSLHHMEKRNVPPVPENYAVWYQYSLGKNPALMSEIERRTAQKHVFDATFNHHLYQDYITSAEEINQHTKMLNGTQDILTDALSVITSIISEADHQNVSIQGKLDDIIQGDSATDITNVLDALVAVAREMKKSSIDMRVSLTESRQEVDGLKKSLAEISIEAQRDFLTGLYNRKALDTQIIELMTEAKELKKPICLLVVDVDHFKKFNDTYGHLIGDEVLKMVAKILTQTLKGRDVVARFGGEEFVILLPSTNIGGAMAVAENIRATIAGKELQHRGTGASFGCVTVSIGVSAFRPDEDTSEAWISRADDALYRSKRSGRNRVTQETMGGKA